MSELRQMSLFQNEPRVPEEISKQTSLKATLNLFREYLRKEGKSQHTLKAFDSDIHLFAEHVGDSTAIGAFTTGDLNQFLDWLENGRGVPCSRKSYARRVTTLKVYFKWLHSIGAIVHDPAKAVLQRSGPAPLSDVLSMQQIQDVLDFSRTMKYKRTQDQDYRPEMLLWLLLDTGIKKGEAIKLVAADIDRLNPRAPSVTVRQRTRNVYKERRISLDPEWLTLFDLYMDQYQPKDTIFTCTQRNLEYILTDIGNGAEIPFKLSFEVLRWTSAVRDHRMGVEDQEIREKLGLSEASWIETGSKIRQLAVKLASSESRS